MAEKTGVCISLIGRESLDTLQLSETELCLYLFAQSSSWSQQWVALGADKDRVTGRKKVAHVVIKCGADIFVILRCFF